MHKRHDLHWFRDRDRTTNEERTEHFYGAGYATHGLRETINRPQPRRYDERHYPHDYNTRPKGRR